MPINSKMTGRSTPLITGKPSEINHLVKGTCRRLTEEMPAFSGAPWGKLQALNKMSNTNHLAQWKLPRATLTNGSLCLKVQWRTLLSRTIGSRKPKSFPCWRNLKQGGSLILEDTQTYWSWYELSCHLESHPGENHHCISVNDLKPWSELLYKQRFDKMASFKSSAPRSICCGPTAFVWTRAKWTAADELTIIPHMHHELTIIPHKHHKH